MSLVSPFYSVNEALKPVEDRVYHNNSACGPGREIKPEDRRPGTNGYRLCKDCAELNR
jgi:hypothetical protein